MKKGDIISIELDAYYASSGELFETTDEALAKEKGLWHDGHRYGPRVHIIASEESSLPTGLEVDFVHAKSGERRTVTLEAKDAFGPHNPLLVETISARELARQGVEPEIGAEVQRRNRTGHISGIFGGRVRVDYNHPLAGKSLKYEYTVQKVMETPAEKVGAILDLHYGRPEEFQTAIDGKNVTVKVPDVCKFDEAWRHQKLQVVLALREHAGFETVSFVEEYIKRQIEEEEPAGEEKPAQAEAGTKPEGAAAEAPTETAAKAPSQEAAREDDEPKAVAAKEKTPKAPKAKAKAAGAK